MVESHDQEYEAGEFSASDDVLFIPVPDEHIILKEPERIDPPISIQNVLHISIFWTGRKRKIFELGLCFFTNQKRTGDKKSTCTRMSVLQMSWAIGTQFAGQSSHDRSCLGLGISPLARISSRKVFGIR